MVKNVVLLDNTEYTDEGIFIEIYEYIKEDIEKLINNGIVVYQSMNHHYAGYMNYKNYNDQLIGVFNNLQDFIDNSLTMANAEYVKFERCYDKLFISTICHDYSARLEIRQMSRLAYELDQYYGFEDFLFNYPQNLHTELCSYDFYGKEYHVEHQEKLINRIDNLEALEWEERANMVLKDLKVSEVLE